MESEIELAYEYLFKHLNELKYLDEHPHLFISEHFYTLRNQIDYEAEKLIEAFQNEHLQEQSIDKVSHLRSKLIDELKKQEAIIMKQEHRKGPNSTQICDEISVKIEQLLAKTKQKKELECKLFNEILNNCDRIYEEIFVQIENEIERVKSEIMNNKSFIFRKLSKTKNSPLFGVLIIFKNKYLKECELSFIK